MSATHRWMLVVLPLVVATLGISGSASANIINNGQFATADLTDWTSSGSVDVATESAYGACCGGINSGSGYMAAFGDDNRSDNGVLSQSFSTTAGRTYSLTFEYGAFGAPTDPFNDINTQSLIVSLTGATFASGGSGDSSEITADATRDFSSLFKTYTYTFVANSTNTTLTFSDGSEFTFDEDGLLTNVDVEALAVPEPSSVALLGVGLLGFGFAAMGRRKRDTA